MPQVFGTITVSDGISMGTEGMKYSLVSREVIADSIETVCQRPEHGRRAGDRRLRQEHAGGDDGDRAPQHPRDLRLRRHHQAGPARRPRPHDRQRLRGGRPARGRQDRRGRAASTIERNACPGAGSCGGMYTANTMSSAIEAMGMSLPYSSTMAAEDAEKAESAGSARRGCWSRRSGSDLLPRRHPHAQGVRERDRGRDGARRLDQRGAAPDWRSRTRPRCRSTSTTSRRSASACRCSAT